MTSESQSKLEAVRKVVEALLTDHFVCMCGADSINPISCSHGCMHCARRANSLATLKQSWPEVFNEKEPK